MYKTGLDILTSRYLKRVDEQNKMSAMETIVMSAEDSDQSTAKLNTLITNFVGTKKAVEASLIKYVATTVKTLKQLMEKWEEALPDELDEEQELKYGITRESYNSLVKASKLVANPANITSVITSNDDNILSDNFKHDVAALSNIGIKLVDKRASKASYEIVADDYDKNFMVDTTVKDTKLTVRDVRRMKADVEKQLSYLEQEPHLELVKRIYEAATVIFDEISNLDKEDSSYLEDVKDNAKRLSRCYLLLQLLKLSFSKLNHDVYTVAASIIAVVSKEDETEFEEEEEDSGETEEKETEEEPEE